MRFIVGFFKFLIKLVIFLAIILGIGIAWVTFSKDGITKVTFKDDSYFEVTTTDGWCPHDEVFLGYLISKIASYQSPSTKGIKIIHGNKCGVLLTKPSENQMNGQIIFMAQELAADFNCLEATTEKTPLKSVGKEVFYCMQQVSEAPSGEALGVVFPVSNSKSMLALIDKEFFLSREAEIIEVLKSASYKKNN